MIAEFNKAFTTKEKFSIALGLLCTLAGVTMCATGAALHDTSGSYSYSTVLSFEISGLTAICIGSALVLYVGKDAIKDSFKHIFSKATEQFKIDKDADAATLNSVL